MLASTTISSPELGSAQPQVVLYFFWFKKNTAILINKALLLLSLWHLSFFLQFNMCNNSIFVNNAVSISLITHLPCFWHSFFCPDLKLLDRTIVYCHLLPVFEIMSSIFHINCGHLIFNGSNSNQCKYCHFTFILHLNIYCISKGLL